MHGSEGFGDDWQWAVSMGIPGHAWAYLVSTVGRVWA